MTTTPGGAALPRNTARKAGHRRGEPRLPWRIDPTAPRRGHNAYRATYTTVSTTSVSVATTTSSRVRVLVARTRATPGFGGFATPTRMRGPNWSSSTKLSAMAAPTRSPRKNLCGVSSSSTAPCDHSTRSTSTALAAGPAPTRTTRMDAHRSPAAPATRRRTARMIALLRPSSVPLTSAADGVRDRPSPANAGHGIGGHSARPRGPASHPNLYRHQRHWAGGARRHGP